MNQTDPLSALHDIYLPPPPGWWPPALGWWILFAVCVGLLIFGLWIGWQRFQRSAYKRTALRELYRLRKAAQRGESSLPATLTDLARLLRRVALVAYPRTQVAGLHGQAWLEFLDATGGEGAFTKGVGHYLADALYSRELPPHLADDQALLFDLARRWIRHSPLLPR